MNEKVLENFYQERLEERIISEFSKVKNISLEEAMDIYYESSLAKKIYEGKNGIQYLDYRVLVQILIQEIEKSRRS